jgi:hypothetical protein
MCIYTHISLSIILKFIMEATTKKFGLDMFQHIIIGECIDL